MLCSKGRITSANITKTERTLLDWVLKRYPETPKTRAKQWIQAGRVSVGGRVIRKPHEPIASDPGAALSLLDRNSTTLDCGSGWQIHPRVSLIYLSAAFAIVNKGPGLLAVPASPGELSALSILADFLSGKLKAQDRGIAGKTLPPAYRRLEPLPVHRLDQYTSGVFCIAMNPSARHHLIEQLRVHTMRREYVAYVEGRSPIPKGTWRQWLELSKDGLRQNIVSESEAKVAGSEAQEAITHFEVLAEYRLGGGEDFVTKLKLRLATGRKHQIRIQAAHAGLPLVGDRIYNPKCRQRSSAIEFPRQALHAEILELEDPEHPGVRMSWRAELPKDLRQLENNLRFGRP